MGKLTDLICRNAKCDGQKILKLGDGDGLYLWVTDRGRKTFNFRYKYLSKPKGLVIGQYPQTSLSDARKETRRLRSLVDDGIDPSAARQLTIRANQSAGQDDNSFEFVGREWYGKQVKSWKPGHARDVLRRMEVNLFPKLGKRSIDEITGPELLSVINIMEARGAFDLAHRVNGVAGQIFRYGIASGRCKFDIAASIVDAITPHEGKHQPAVNPEDVPKLMREVGQYDQVGERQTQLGLLVLAHTWVRTSELIKAKKTEFDLDERQWVIPAERMKRKKKQKQYDHLVPLTEPVISYILELFELSGDSEYLLPGRNILTHISNNTLLFALYRLGYKGKMSGHGFRAVASTICNESGWNTDWIERQLAHVEENKVRGAYNRAMYIKDRRRMMEWWSAYLVAVASDTAPPDPDL